MFCDLINKFSWKLVFVQDFCPIFKIVFKTFPCVADFVAPTQQSFNGTIFYLEEVKLQKIVNKPVYVAFL